MAMEAKEPSKTQGKPIRCKAAVCRKAGEPLVIEEVIVAPPRPREVRIRVICTSLCHSDITFWKLQVPPAICPRILGHEAIGIVESVGENVDEVAEGDVVLPTFLPDCGECTDCKSKKSNLCSKFPFEVSPCMPRYHDSRFTDLNGEVLHHFLFVSSFSKYTVVDVANITKVDPAIPPNRACLLSCGVSTGVGAAWRTAGVEPGSTVAIFGLGAIGLAVAEGARLCGATRIIGVDLNPEKFELGKKFGVTDFVNSANCGDKSVSQVIKEMTDGGADYCFECVGMASLVHEAYACCRKGWGKTIVLGVDKPGTMLSLSSSEVLHSGKSLMGSLFGGIKAKTDIPVLLKRYMDKELRLDEFVTHEVKFEEINEAFNLLLEGKCLRCTMYVGYRWLKTSEYATRNQPTASLIVIALKCCKHVVP
ncbi:Alcohol dehydrogenase-like, C-terminal [Dillenia turbinata]|uniref:Alcohol dehydrogenase-like, C-terminal n=1 Tax=Dillenia turbinata TaxID=194707 RepID=A0AAN8VS18_9MAGN